MSKLGCREVKLIAQNHAISGEGNGNPLQYSCLGNPMDRGAWWAIAHGIAKSQTWLSEQQKRHLYVLSWLTCHLWGTRRSQNNILRKRGLGFELTINTPLESLDQPKEVSSHFASARLPLPGSSVLYACVSPGTERVKLTHNPQDPETFSFWATYVDGLWRRTSLLLGNHEFLWSQPRIPRIQPGALCRP